MTVVNGVSMFRAVGVLLLAARKVRVLSSGRPTVSVWLAVAGALSLVGCGSSNKPPTSTTTVVTRTVAATRTSSTSQTSAASDPLAGLVATVRSAVIRIQTDACGLREIGTGFLSAHAWWRRSSMWWMELARSNSCRTAGQWG